MQLDQETGKKIVGIVSFAVLLIAINLYLPQRLLRYNRL